MSGPLSGVRVLDAGQIVAGPFAATLLADYGADVVKMERRGKGDPLRGLSHSKDGVGLWWHAVNRNKRTIALDLTDEADREVFLRLAAAADVLVESFVPGTLERMGLGYDVLSAANPKLILLRVSGYGQEGPYSRWPGFARTSEAFSGLTNLNGFPDRPPANFTAFALADYLTGLFGAFAITSALRERDMRSGQGQVIDLALYDGPFRMMELQCAAYDQLGILGKRTGGTIEYAAPVGIWTSRDGIPIQMAIGTDPMARSFFAAIGRAELADDPRFATSRSRVEHRPELEALAGDWIGGHDATEVLNILAARGIAAAPMMTMETIFKDAQYAARENLVQIDDPRLGKVAMPNVIPRLSRTPGNVRHAGREMDQDREDIVRDWIGPAAG